MGDRVAEFGGFEVEVGEREVLDCEGESFGRDRSCCGGHCGSDGMRVISWNGTVKVGEARVMFTIKGKVSGSESRLPTRRASASATIVPYRPPKAYRRTHIAGVQSSSTYS